MLLAINVNNTHTMFGLWDGAAWVGVWRRATAPEETEDQLAVWLKGLFDLVEKEFKVEAVVCSSVVPQMNRAISLLCERWLGVVPYFLSDGAALGLEVCYDPPSAVGADRLANALAALELGSPPIIVVDFGTATTFDVIDARGRYIGGAIMPGVQISSQALAARAARLQQIELRAPERAVGRNTVESMQSGVMLGYASAVDGLSRRIRSELGGKAKILSTGGLGSLFVDLCEEVESHHPTLTLDGLVVAHRRLA